MDYSSKKNISTKKIAKKLEILYILGSYMSACR